MVAAVAIVHGSMARAGSAVQDLVGEEENLILAPELLPFLVNVHFSDVAWAAVPGRPDMFVQIRQ